MSGPASPVTPEEVSRPGTPETPAVTSTPRRTSYIGMSGPATSASPMVALTTQQLQQLVASLQTGQGGTREPKIEDPELFSGDRRKVRSFLTQCDLVYQSKPRTYPTDQAKVAYASGRLRGNAWDWVESSIVDGVSTYKTWVSFKDALKKAFGEADTREVARRKLHHCKQGQRSAAMYWSEFQKIKNDLDYNDATYIDFFYDGLYHEVQRQLSLLDDLPKTLLDYAHKAISLDNKLYNYRTAHKLGERKTNDPYRSLDHQRSLADSHPQPQIHHNKSFADPDPYGPKPMDIDLDATRSKRFYKLSEKERQRRIKERLCFTCGKPGHVTSECYKNKNKSSAGYRKGYKVSEASMDNDSDTDSESGKEEVQD